DRGRDDRLNPDPQHTPDLLPDDRPKTDQVDRQRARRLMRLARRKLRRERPLPLAHVLAPACLPSTSRMNSSSRRLVLVRIVTTLSCCAVSSSKTLFRPCSLSTSTSIS